MFTVKAMDAVVKASTIGTDFSYGNMFFNFFRDRSTISIKISGYALKDKQSLRECSISILSFRVKCLKLVIFQPPIYTKIKG